MTPPIRPLSRGKQLLLQRLMASHVMTDDDLRDLYDSIKASAGEDGGVGDMGRNLGHCLGVINASLGPAFGLEVRTVALSERVAPPPSKGDADATSSSSSDEGGGSENGRPIKYHSVVNKLSDAVSKSSANHGPYARNPHELELLKIILERIVERHLENLENDEDESSNGRAGCDAALRRMECINLRTELKGAHKGKVGLRDAERAISAFVAEGWLLPTQKPKSATPSPAKDDEEGEEGDGTQDGTQESTPSSSSRLRKRNRRSMDGLGVGDDDDSGETKSKGNYLMIGPRTYMELPDALTDFGLGRERMPQFILHGSG